MILDSVLGIRCDPKGIVWMLDNGRRSDRPPKLVAWDSNRNQFHKVIELAAPAVFIVDTDGRIVWNQIGRPTPVAVPVETIIENLP